MKWSEMNISLNHDVMASFPHLKWTQIPKSEASLAGALVYAYHGCLNGLRWMSASTMTLWYHFYSPSDLETPNLGPTWLL